jgi:hypothetical protein
MMNRTLFAFIDLKDPFMAAEIAGEESPGPILSLLEARRFDNLNLFYTPALKAHAEATQEELIRRYPGCELKLHELSIADPKDYSAVMGSLARKVREIARSQIPGENSVCVSSGTAEMRAVWFLLTAAGILPATLLQVGSPAEPLFGAANVKEVRFDAGDWSRLRDLLMPMDYFHPSAAPLARSPRRNRREADWKRGRNRPARPIGRRCSEPPVWIRPASPPRSRSGSLWLGSMPARHGPAPTRSRPSFLCAWRRPHGAADRCSSE